MTGTLPGVECARRRRIHYTVGGSDSPSTSGSGFTRRSSFCLYTSSHESQLITSSSSSMQRNMVKQEYENENLGKVAREAKERLDERLRAQRKSETKRSQERLRIMGGRNSPSNQEILRGKEIENRTKTSTTQEKLKGIDDRSMVLRDLHIDDRSMVPRDLQTEVFGLKKSGLKRLNWAKLGGKGLEPEECAVCLDQFKVGETLVHLPCAHRFHSRCLEPWLENNAHCPCCRMELLS